ncbi:hypothetical protein FACS189454_04430 [Planctomycetales bacterium]|nr:hypothetical protein FACS189454_04430 [Planctomycetales bacterium]
MQILDQEIEVQNLNNRISAAENTDALSAPHIGRWNKLVSQTNWEKGLLILSWRNDLIHAGLENVSYSDETWSNLVGHVSPQHTGRLRRVAERFGGKKDSYTGLFWSHFNAALEWEDAELWLEGAIQNDWSVAQMKVQRADVVGASETLKPDESDIYVGEMDESELSGHGSDSRLPQSIGERPAMIHPAGATEGFDAANLGADKMSNPATDHKPKREKRSAEPDRNNNNVNHAVSTADALTKIQCLRAPADIADTFESLKLAVLKYKSAGWKEISQAELANCFDTFKMLIYSIDE